MLEVLLVFINSNVIQRIYGYILLAIYEVFLVQWLKKRKIIVSFLGHFPIWLFVISGLIYGIAANIVGQQFTISIVSYCMLPVLIFATGYIITNNEESYSISNAERCLYAIAIGCAIHVILNIYANFGLTNRSSTIEYFTGQRLAATNMGSLNTYIFALLPCLIITKKKKVKIIGLILFSFSVIYAFMIGTRSTVYGLIIMTGISIVIYIRRHYLNGLNKKTLIKWTIRIIGVISIVYYIYLYDFLRIRTNIEKSILLQRYQTDFTRISDVSRRDMFVKGIIYLFEYPLGGNKVQGLNYFHNYWLDVGRISGIIPVILIIILDVILIKHMLTIFKNKNINEPFRYAVFGIYVCVFINFFVEPIMDGYLDLFYRFTFVNGMVEGIYNVLRQKKCRLYSAIEKRF